MKGRTFPSQNQAHMIYKDFEEELNILLFGINVLDIFQLSDVYQIKMYARSELESLRFSLVVQNTCAAKCNFVAE